MKKLVKVCTLAVVMLLCGQTMAQTRGVMSLGASFPMKDYADFDGFNEFALMSHDEDDGGAGIGFNAGLKWYFNMGVKGLGVMLSVDGLYNGPCPDLKTAYRDKEVEMNNVFKYDATPKYINVPAMLGLNYIFHFNPNFGLYVEAGAGGNLRLITDLAATTRQDDTKIVVNNDYDKAFTFAYQAGIGFEVAKNLVIGCSFYDLGKAQVKGEETIVTKNTVAGNTNSTTKNQFNTFGTVHPYFIMARIGFSF